MARSIIQRGTIAAKPERYGLSVDGAPLQIWLPVQSKVEVLVFAGIHGEEPDSTVLLSRALRSLAAPSSSCAVIVCANPDGVRLGTRGNASGVDLNRNFPSRNWQPEQVTHNWGIDSGYRVALSPGHKPCSEPETQALMQVVEDLKPEYIVSIHSPLGLIDDPEATDLGRFFSARSGLPRTVLPNENTPGSFGSWSKDIGIATITYELPNRSIWDMLPVHMPILHDLLEHGLEVVGNRHLNREENNAAVTKTGTG
jgi:murein peptide amidase A